MADRTGLAGEAATGDRRDDVILADAVGDAEHLVDDQAQGRPGEIDLLVAAVDRDLAGAGLQPDAGDRVLAATGGISAALLVELLLAQDGLDLRTLGVDAVLVDLLVPAAAAVAAVAFGALRTGGSSRFGLGSVSFRSVGFDGLGRGGLGSFGLGRISGFSFGRGSLFGSRLGGGGLGRLAGQPALFTARGGGGGSFGRQGSLRMTFNLGMSS